MIDQALPNFINFENNFAFLDIRIESIPCRGTYYEI